MNVSKENNYENFMEQNKVNQIASKYFTESVLILDKQGKIVFASESTKYILGKNVKLLLNNSILKFKWLKILTLKNLNSTDSPLFTQPHHFKFDDQKGKSRFLELICFQHKEDHSGEIKIIMKIRMSNVQNMELGFNVSSIDKYNTLFSNTSLGIVEVDNNEKIIFANKGFEKITGYTEDELKGKYGPEVLLDDESQKKINIDQRKNRYRGNEGFYEIRIKSKNMGHKNLIISGTPIFDENGKVKGSIGIHWDITETRKMDSKFLFESIQKEKQLIEARIQAEENQREVIGRDLHDGVGQMLVYLDLYMKLLKEKQAIRHIDIEKAEITIKKILDEIRRISRNLAPPTIKELGLKDSIIELIGSFSMIKSPLFKLKIYKGPDPQKLLYEQKIMIYRILQELCSNTFKYASAKYIHIELNYNTKELILKYKDDGLGFNIKKIKTGIGLKGIVSRIEYYGGNFLIETEPNKGIHVLINLPFFL
jgi:PAS domain S-box-containing protein